MDVIRPLLLLAMLLLQNGKILAQPDNLAFPLAGVVYDEYFRPIPYTHVLAAGTGEGDVTDSLGIFSIYIRASDKLTFINLSFNDTLVSVSKEDKGFYVQMTRKYYQLKEAKVFSWGSTYGDFLQEVKRKGDVTTDGEKLGLPVQNPDYIPFEMNEAKLKSAGFLLSSPISFFYYNLSRHEKAARKAYQLKKDQPLIDIFESTLSRENISYITGYKEDELESFMIYLNEHLQCTYHCPELTLITEIYRIWEEWKK